MVLWLLQANNCENLKLQRIEFFKLYKNWKFSKGIHLRWWWSSSAFFSKGIFLSSTFPFSTYLISISIFFLLLLKWYSTHHYISAYVTWITSTHVAGVEWNKMRKRESGWWGKRGHKWTQMLKIENMMYCYWKFIRYFLETITECMIKPFLCIHSLHSLTHSFYIVVHMASRLYGGSSVRCCCLHCHGYFCESLSLSLSSPFYLCKNIFHTRILCTHSEHEKCLIFQL